MRRQRTDVGALGETFRRHHVCRTADSRSQSAEDADAVLVDESLEVDDDELLDAVLDESPDDPALEPDFPLSVL